jgi:serine/threonine protein kinase
MTKPKTVLFKKSKKKKSYKSKIVLFAKSKKKNTSKGGDVLGLGSSGCIIHPNIQCKNYLSTDVYVSKIINKDNLKYEFDKVDYMKLNNIPNHQKYIILPDDYCYGTDINENYLNDEQKKDLSICKSQPHLSDLNENINIIQVYGGKTFYNYRLDYSDEDFDGLLPYYKQLFEALILLNDNGYSHRDIKHQNIVINVDVGSIKLIDIGHLIFTDNTKNTQAIIDNKFNPTIDKDFLKSGYFIWPMEVYVFADLYQQGHVFNPITLDIINNYLNKYNRYWLTDEIKETYRKIMVLAAIDINKYINDLENMIDINLKTTKINEWISTFLSKLDVFSFGTVLLFELRKLFPINKTTQQLEFYNKLSEVIFNKMVFQDCLKRSSIHEAFQEFQNICSQYSKSLDFEDDDEYTLEDEGSVFPDDNIDKKKSKYTPINFVVSPSYDENLLLSPSPSNSQPQFQTNTMLTSPSPSPF